LGFQEDFNPKLIKELAKDRLASKERVFTGAYVITNQGIKAPKQDVVVDYFLTDLWAAATDLCHIAYSSRSWEQFIDAMRKIQGFGGTGFMAKEVTLDTFFTSVWKEPPFDLNIWSPCGPGARRGLNRIYNRDIKAAKPEEQFLFEMQTIFAQRGRLWPKKFIELELHDIQFQLCEYDKYLRVQNGEGRPRSKYKPK
jgi:hypothetical protein